MINQQGALAPQPAGLSQEVMQIIDAVLSGAISLEEAAELTGIPVHVIQELLMEGADSSMGSLQMNEGGQVWKPGQNVPKGGQKSVEEVLQDFQLQSLGTSGAAAQAAAQGQQPGAVGSALGSVGGAAIGNMVLPGAGGVIGSAIGGSLGGLLGFNEGGGVPPMPGDVEYLQQGGWSPYKTSGQQGQLQPYRLASLGTAGAAAQAAAQGQKARQEQLDFLKDFATTEYTGEDGEKTTLFGDAVDAGKSWWTSRTDPDGIADEYKDRGIIADATHAAKEVIAGQRLNREQIPQENVIYDESGIPIYQNKGGGVLSNIGPYLLAMQQKDDETPLAAQALQTGILGLIAKNLNQGGSVGPLASVEHKVTKGNTSKHHKQTYHNPMNLKGGM